MSTVLARPNLVVVRVLEPSRVAEGEGARTVLTLTNRGSRRSLPVHAVEQVGGQRVAVPLPGLPAGGSHRAAYPLPTDRRGVHAVGPLTVGVSDPLRLLHSSRDVASGSVLVVHPRVHRVLPVPAGRSRDQDGATDSSAVRGGVAFHSLRPYERGDDPRHIHWRSTARVGEPVVREHVVPNEPELLVVLDTSADPYDAESFEEAVRVTASLAVAGCESGHPMTLLTTAGQRAAADRGPDGRRAVLDLLAGTCRNEDDPGLRALTRLGRVHAGTSLGVVTGRPHDVERACVGTVRTRFQLTTLVEVGPAPTDPRPPLRGVFGVQAPTAEAFAALWNQRVRR